MKLLQLILLLCNCSALRTIKLVQDTELNDSKNGLKKVNIVSSSLNEGLHHKNLHDKNVNFFRRVNLINRFPQQNLNSYKKRESHMRLEDISKKFLLRKKREMENSTKLTTERTMVSSTTKKPTISTTTRKATESTTSQHNMTNITTTTMLPSNTTAKILKTTTMLPSNTTAMILTTTTMLPSNTTAKILTTTTILPSNTTAKILTTTSSQPEKWDCDLLRNLGLNYPLCNPGQWT